MIPQRKYASLAFALLCTAGLVCPVRAQQPASPPKPPANELDAFMEKVLKRRDVNRQTLQQYVLDETEQFEVLGPARMPVYRQKREYAWYVRDGLHVRSPVRFDGVAVGDEERKKYEEEWAQRERKRLESKDKKAKEADKKEEVPETVQAGPEGSTAVPTPRFVSEAYFMDFKFEPGNYYLAGREQLDGQQVLRIEYYPKHMFDDSEERQNEKKKEDEEKGREEDRQGDRLRTTHRAPDEQDGARDALGRSGRASDRQVHLRQRLDGLPARAPGSSRSTISARR